MTPVLGSLKKVSSYVIWPIGSAKLEELLTTGGYKQNFFSICLILQANRIPPLPVKHCTDWIKAVKCIWAWRFICKIFFCDSKAIIATQESYGLFSCFSKVQWIVDLTGLPSDYQFARFCFKDQSHCIIISYYYLNRIIAIRTHRICLRVPALS